jgi:hypothetical protein
MCCIFTARVKHLSEYSKISLKKEFMNKIEQFIREYPEHGYRSLAQFIEDAVRRRADELRISEFTPRLRDLNTYEDHVTIMDKKLGWDDKEGKRQPRIIDIYIRPVGEKGYDFWCEYCDSNECEHVYYVLSIPHITTEPLRRKGWTYKGKISELEIEKRKQ